MQPFSPTTTSGHRWALRLLAGAWILLAVVLAMALGGLISSPEAVADQNASREEYRRELSLVRNHPNPFNPATNISYSLPEPAYVRVDVYDLKGRQVVCLVDEVQESGMNMAVWKTETAPSGTYILSLQAGGVRVFRKMSLVR